MKHVALVCGALLLSGGLAQAKDFCIGSNGVLGAIGPVFSQLQLKGVKPGRRQFGSVQGLLTEASSASSFGNFSSTEYTYSISGQTQTSSTGELLVGLVLYPVHLEVARVNLSPPQGPQAVQTGSAPAGVTIVCEPGPNGTVAVGSSCNLVGLQGGASKVIACPGLHVP
jgi:hypothetical protein